MIALLTTYFLVFYVFIPGALFRVPASFFLRLKLFQLTKIQEVTFAIQVALLPFLISLVLVWFVWPATVFPCGFVSSSDVRGGDYRAVTQLVLASDSTKLLSSAGGTSGTWSALARVIRRQIRTLSWLYLLTILEGSCFIYLAYRYGDWRVKHKWYETFATKFIIPRISEWQVLLTPFIFPRVPERIVFGDILSSDGTLYRGEVAAYFLDLNGSLSGIQMEFVERFKKKQFDEAIAIHQERSKEAPLVKLTDSRGEDYEKGKVDPEHYWKVIPGANFYIPASQVVNVNLHFPFKNPKDLVSSIKASLAEHHIDAEVSIDVEQNTQDQSEAQEEESVADQKN
jgi:hypothetical protein